MEKPAKQVAVINGLIARLANVIHVSTVFEPSEYRDFSRIRKAIMLPSSLNHVLATAADRVIATVLAHGGTHTAKPNGEVTAVRTMTLDGFDGIAAVWSPILYKSGYSVDLRAVFCHSRPHVTFAPVPHPNYLGGTTPRRCELADLLIVIDHIDPYKKVDERRAVLVQAKMLKGGMLKPSGKEWVQHELLAWHPAFTFIDKGYNLRSRDFRGGTVVGLPTYTAEYGGIDLKSSPPEWRHEITQTTAPWFKSPLPLSDYIAGMATGNPDCSREAVRGGSDDWSFTVDELLRVTAARPMSRKSSLTRGNDNTIGFIIDTSSFESSDVGGGGGYVEDDTTEWPEGPISTIHFTFGSIDERRE